MTSRPTRFLRVTIDDGPPVTVALPVTVWTPSNGYHSGDYAADVGDVSLRISDTGLFAASYGGCRLRTFASTRARVVFDFTGTGGPVVFVERQVTL